ncbi:hypothetical protein XBKQ1_2780006 [Xenorhabdus bovienii str. kraussei Quebec]|uniref:Uncharacterized protein n=1 Tax=Xenorhabdus bovienii str. kraussei Quebec TaxID=1398203 RepID=A0A077PJ59_XENBV|nr:hypothetical protein XBKQ1_2780006 [Xenorhabdus bovienii str. kraussei Quebec]
MLETHYLGSGRAIRSILRGTCISIIAIAIYATFVSGSRMM